MAQVAEGGSSCRRESKVGVAAGGVTGKLGAVERMEA